MDKTVIVRLLECELQDGINYHRRHTSLHGDLALMEEHHADSFPLIREFETTRIGRNGLGRNRAGLEIDVCLYGHPVVIAFSQMF